MQQNHAFTEADEGKRVVDATGRKVGLVAAVRDGTAYVDADPGVFDTIKAKLGWDDIDEDTYPLRQSEVASVTDDEIRLNRQ